MSANGARREKTQVPETQKNTWIWIQTFLLMLALLLPLRFFVFQPVRVEQTSMSPTLADGETMATFKLSYHLGEPHRGDVVVCQFPGETDYFVKRLIAIPGDMLCIQDGVVYVNGQPIQEDYVVNPSHEDIPAFRLEDDELYVMGDNRAISRDSRSVGPIKRAMLVSRVAAVIWPPAHWRSVPSQSVIISKQAASILDMAVGV